MPIPPQATHSNSDAAQPARYRLYYLANSLKERAFSVCGTQCIHLGHHVGSIDAIWASPLGGGYSSSLRFDHVRAVLMAAAHAVVVAFDFQLVGGDDGRRRDKSRPFSAQAYRRPRASPCTKSPEWPPAADRRD
jgi:hypothetical protein